MRSARVKGIGSLAAPSSFGEDVSVPEVTSPFFLGVIFHSGRLTKSATVRMI